MFGEFNQVTFKVITAKEGLTSVILLFVFHMLHSFFCPSFFLHSSLLLCLVNFCDEMFKFLLNFILYMYFVAIFFVANMGITFNILKLQHSNLNITA